MAGTSPAMTTESVTRDRRMAGASHLSETHQPHKLRKAMGFAKTLYPSYDRFPYSAAIWRGAGGGLARSLASSA
jgi:hypothetical protein